MASSLLQTYQVTAEREVVLSAGAVATPKLLLLSGVGPEQHLKDHQVRILQAKSSMPHTSGSYFYFWPVHNIDCILHNDIHTRGSCTSTYDAPFPPEERNVLSLLCLMQVDVIANLAGVGRNLQDHVGVFGLVWTLPGSPSPSGHFFNTTAMHQYARHREGES